MRVSRLVPVAMMAALVFGCSEENVFTAAPDGGDGVPVSGSAKTALQLSVSMDGQSANQGAEQPATDLGSRMASINEELAASGAAFRIEKAEISFAKNAPPDAASIVFANDRTLRLSSRWVPRDPRREADGDKITYLVDRDFALANGDGGEIDSESAIDASFGTWDDLTCSNLDIVKRDDTDPNPNLVLALFGFVDFQTANPNAADITTTGFLPGFVFDFLQENGSQFILGVTWTLIFVDQNGPTDIDGNGYADTGLKEVWYNNAFTWTDTGVGDDVDIETVALHENGHALELGHFGKVHATFSPKGGRLHVSPRAVMNAFILGTLRDPLGTDNASYCGIFAAWPTPH